MFAALRRKAALGGVAMRIAENAYALRGVVNRVT